MRTTHALLATVAVSLSASLLLARVARSDNERFGGDAREVAQPMVRRRGHESSAEPPIYPGPAPGLPGTPPGMNPATPPGANPGNNPARTPAPARGIRAMRRE